MNKRLILVLFIISALCSSLYSISEINEYNDLGLTEKNGTFGIPNVMRKSYTRNTGTFLTKENYIQWSHRLHMMVDYPELLGFFLNFDFMVQRSNAQFTGAPEFDKVMSFVLYPTQAYIGFKNKYTTVQFGFQNQVSSDAIYNHLLIDDYSGSFFGLKWNQLLGRFVDIEIVYNFVRPHNGSWDVFGATNYNDDNYTYNTMYGKSFFTKKLNIRPVPWVRFGIMDGVFFLGENFNPWYLNPFSIYFVTNAAAKLSDTKDGTSLNTEASNTMFSVDFNVGFDGWRVYGEMFVDDIDARHIFLMQVSIPERVGFQLGGELRGYLFTKYISMPRRADYILSRLYVNFEYTIVSKYTYSRDGDHNYEFVRDEYTSEYNPANPPDKATVDRVNRTGNFIGFMYGNNSDCIDLAVGWRTDLKNIREYTAGYQGDVFFDSKKKKKISDIHLFKVQLHWRMFRLGDERNVTMPYYWNEHYYFEMDPNVDTNGDGINDNDEDDDDSPGDTQSGTNRRGEFVRVPVYIGNIVDLALYTDIFRLGRTVVGLDLNFNWFMGTTNPFTQDHFTDVNFKFEFAFTFAW